MSGIPPEAAHRIAIGALLPSLAHELGNALTGILGTARLLEAGAVSARDRAHLERLTRDAERARRLLDDVAALARDGEPAADGPATLDRAVRDALRLSGGELLACGIDIVEEAPEGGASTAPLETRSADATLLVLSLVRLASAAITISRRPGRISVATARVAASGALRVALVASPAAAAAPSAGLEMFTARLLAERCGAVLEVAPGDSGALLIAASFGPACTTARLRRVLVVDDEPVLALVLAEAFRGFGYEVDVVHDGARGAEMALGGEYDLVVSDLHMPGFDGERMCETIRARRPELLRRVIVASGDASLGGRRERLVALGVPVVEKPFRAETLAAAARSVLRGRG